MIWGIQHRDTKQWFGGFDKNDRQIWDVVARTCFDSKEQAELQAYLLTRFDAHELDEVRPTKLE